jgi:hypothetical protein
LFCDLILWNFPDQTILSPQDFEEKVEFHFKDSKLKATVEYVFAGCLVFSFNISFRQLCNIFSIHVLQFMITSSIWRIVLISTWDVASKR